MAIDLLIFGLIVISFIVNLLALGAFWIAPGLRTTANRFTINLLIINIIGCLILAPTLFITGSLSSYTNNSEFATKTNDDRIEFLSKPDNRQMTIRHNGKLVEQEGIILKRNVTTPNEGSIDPRTIETIYKCNNTFCQELTIDEGRNMIVITEVEERNLMAETDNSATDKPNKALPLQPNMRCWSIDLTSALGTLAVLLVVGDTWCAITDPLRYHSRISGVKSWIFIGLTWSIGIVFGVFSAFRQMNFESEIILSKQKNNFANSYINLSATNDTYDIIYACMYFVIIILLPFGCVCGMYWRIFSEARGNGIRIRQNGSSPLLQSALNLTHHQPTTTTPNNLYVHRSSISSTSSHGDGLHMQIDHRNHSPSRLRRATISDYRVSEGADSVSTTNHLIPLQKETNDMADRNQNIFLTFQAPSDEIKRNYSAHQLLVVNNSSQNPHQTKPLRNIRQVCSSPNLQKYVHIRTDSVSDRSCTPHTLRQHQLHHIYMHGPHARNLQPCQHHILQIPSVHTSPKALSYMSSLRHRLSNASSLFKYRDESRAARISILVVIMFLVSYIPFGCLVLLQSLLAKANFVQSSQLAIFFILLANISSPFIFAYRNKRVRRGIRQLFGLDVHFLRSSRTQTSSVYLKRNDSKLSMRSPPPHTSSYSTPQIPLITTTLQTKNHNTTLATITSKHETNTVYNLPSNVKKIHHKGNIKISTSTNNNNEEKAMQVSKSQKHVVCKMDKETTTSKKFLLNRSVLKTFYQHSQAITAPHIANDSEAVPAEV